MTQFPDSIFTRLNSRTGSISGKSGLLCFVSSFLINAKYDLTDIINQKGVGVDWSNEFETLDGIPIGEILPHSINKAFTDKTFVMNINHAFIASRRPPVTYRNAMDENVTRIEITVINDVSELSLLKSALVEYGFEHNVSTVLIESSKAFRLIDCNDIVQNIIRKLLSDFKSHFSGSLEETINGYIDRELINR